jgi:hypothetical protein
LAHANLGRFMKNDLDPVERIIDKLFVTNVALDKFGCGI